MDNLYEISNLDFSYAGMEEINSLHNINLNIKKGETVLICGESGCGKSTILRLLNGLIPNYFEGVLKGSVKLNGREVQKYSVRELAGTVGTVFQNPKSQFFTLDTSSELAFGCENLGIKPEDISNRIHQVVREFKIEELFHKDLFEMSGGEKQKIACCCISAMKPEIILLDEPSSNLDAKSVRDLQTIMKKWKKEGKTIVIVEHRLQYALGIADRVIYMKNGEVAGDYTKDSFRKLNTCEIEKMGLRMITSQSLFHEEKKNMEKGTIVVKNFMHSYDKKEKPKLLIEHAEFPENEIIAVVGNNGAGKSTFGESMCGLFNDKTNRLVYKGKEYRPKDLRKLSYLIFQDVNHQLFTESVCKEMTLGMDRKLKSNQDTDERILRILSHMHLYEKKECHPMSLSGGEKQRTAVATALLQKKDIFIFDEPTSGLDYRNMKAVCDSLKELQGRGKSVFVITHDAELIYKSCKYVVFFENGTIKWQSYLNQNIKNKLDDFFAV